MIMTKQRKQTKKLTHLAPQLARLRDEEMIRPGYLLL
jgi:hypothetical protein